jgi:hypothetical protein
LRFCTAGTQSYPVFSELPPLPNPCSGNFSERQRATDCLVSMLDQAHFTAAYFRLSLFSVPDGGIKRAS